MKRRMKIFIAPLFSLSIAATAVQAQESAVDGYDKIIVTDTDRPVTAFSPTPEDEAVYDKYFYFHRDGTDFAEAYADIRECDSLSSGISFYLGSGEPYPGYYGGQYGMAGVIGAAIGNALADAIHGSAQRRKFRRINMRNCMGFKEYSRYGLSKDLWEEFNFEEGHGRKAEEVRIKALQRQALIASGPKPDRKALAR
jgi:hypothetical protein